MPLLQAHISTLFEIHTPFPWQLPIWRTKHPTYSFSLAPYLSIGTKYVRTVWSAHEFITRTWSFKDWSFTTRAFVEKGCKITFKCPWINLEMTFRWYFDVQFDCPRDVVCISYFWFVFLDSYRLWFPMQHNRWKKNKIRPFTKGHQCIFGMLPW